MLLCKEAEEAAKGASPKSRDPQPPDAPPRSCHVALDKPFNPAVSEIPRSSSEDDDTCSVLLRELL